MDRPTLAVTQICFLTTNIQPCHEYAIRTINVYLCGKLLVVELRLYNQLVISPGLVSKVYVDGTHTHTHTCPLTFGKVILNVKFFQKMSTN